MGVCNSGNGQQTTASSLVQKTDELQNLNTASDSASEPSTESEQFGSSESDRLLQDNFQSSTQGQILQ